MEALLLVGGRGEGRAGVTDRGLALLEDLAFLESVTLVRPGWVGPELGITNAGLAALARVPALTRVAILGTVGLDRTGAAEIAAIPGLTELWLARDMGVDVDLEFPDATPENLERVRALPAPARSASGRGMDPGRFVPLAGAPCFRRLRVVGISPRNLLGPWTHRSLRARVDVTRHRRFGNWL